MNRSVHSNVVMNNLVALRDYLLRHDRMDALPALMDAIEIPAPPDNGRISLETVCRNTHRVAEILDDPCMGLELAAHLVVGELTVIDAINAQLGNTRRRMRQHPLMVIRLLERYLRIQSEVVDLDCQVTRDHYRLTLTPYSEVVTHHQIDGAMIVLHRLFELLVPEKVLSLHVSHAGTEQTAKRFREYFGVTPEFNAPANLLVYSNTSRTAAQVDDYLDTVTRNEQILFRQFPHMSFSERCRGAIRLLLTLGEPRREYLCHIFATSLPTLKRRLQAEGTSYASLVREERMQLADQYARDRTLSVTETALLLGYQDVHQYSRAFKHWFGHAPTEHAG